MKCPDPPAHPATGTLRGPLLALAALAALALAVYVVSLLGGVLVALFAEVMAGMAVTVVVTYAAVRWLYRFVLPGRPQPRIRVTLQEGRLGAELVVAAERRALPAARPVVQGVVLDAGERLEA